MTATVHQLRPSVPASLLEGLAERIPQPVDELEVAAVIESMGITDDVAAAEYDAPDVFVLAARVYPDLVRVATRRLAVERGSAPRPEEVAEAALPITGVSSRGFLAIAPLAILMVLMHLLGRAGWTTSEILSLCFGASLAMLLTAGPVLAMGRRTAIYVGFGHEDPARRFTVRAAGAIVGACIGVAAVAVLLGTIAGVGTSHERVVFGLAAVAFGLLSVGSSALAVARRAWVPPVCFVIGLAVGIPVAVAVSPDTGIVAGYLAAIAGLALAWHLTFRGDDAHPMRLPAAGPLLVEAAPYLAYGALFAVFFLEPHVLGWLGESDGSTLDRLRVFELSFLLALPPVLLAAGVHEIAMEAFWVYTRGRKWRDGRATFNAALAAFHRKQVVRYASVLAGVTVACIAVVEVLMLTGVLHGVSHTVFLFAALATALMGLGQFNCLFMMSLARPGAALVATAAGLATVTIVGVPLAAVDYRLAAAACAAGAAIFAIAAWIGCRQLIVDVDHHYATAF